jgi:hypothetical protein
MGESKNIGGSIAMGTTVPTHGAFLRGSRLPAIAGAEPVKLGENERAQLRPRSAGRNWSSERYKKRHYPTLMEVVLPSELMAMSGEPGIVGLLITRPKYWLLVLESALGGATMSSWWITCPPTAPVILPGNIRSN